MVSQEQTCGLILHIGRKRTKRHRTLKPFIILIIFYLISSSKFIYAQMHEPNLHKINTEYRDCLHPCLMSGEEGCVEIDS